MWSGAKVCKPSHHIRWMMNVSSDPLTLTFSEYATNITSSSSTTTTTARIIPVQSLSRAESWMIPAQSDGFSHDTSKMNQVRREKGGHARERIRKERQNHVWFAKMDIDPAENEAPSLKTF